MVELANQSQPAFLPPEDYLWQFLSARKAPLDHQVLQKDRGIFRKIGVFEKDLPGFLAQPQIIQIGQTMLNLEGQMDKIEAEHPENMRSVNDQLRQLDSSREHIRADLGQLRRRIEGVGRNRFIQAGDFSLVWGRIQVKLYNLIESGKITNFGKAVALFIKPRPVHPLLEKPEASLAEVESERKAALEEKQAKGTDYLTAKIGVGNALAGQQEQLFENLDGFATTSLDHLLVYSLYYRRLSAVEHYAQKNRLIGKGRRDLLQLMTGYGVIPTDYSRFLTTLDPEVKSKEALNSAKKASEGSGVVLKMIINGEVLQDREAARAAFFGLERGLSNKTKRLMFRRLEYICEALSLGQTPNTFTRIVAEDLIERMGGQWHTRIGRHRMIMNFRKSETGERMLEVVRIVKNAHDDPEYY